MCLSSFHLSICAKSSSFCRVGDESQSGRKFAKLMKCRENAVGNQRKVKWLQKPIKEDRPKKFADRWWIVGILKEFKSFPNSSFFLNLEIFSENVLVRAQSLKLDVIETEIYFDLNLSHFMSSQCCCFNPSKTKYRDFFIKNLEN